MTTEWNIYIWLTILVAVAVLTSPAIMILGKEKCRYGRVCPCARCRRVFRRR